MNVTNDVSSLMGFGNNGSRVFAAIFALSNIVYVIWTMDRVQSPWPSILAVIIVTGATWLLMLGHRDPFPMLWTLGVVAAVATSTALINWQLPLEGELGRESWHLGSNTWLLFFLTMRGRAKFAWLAFVLMGGITYLWATDTGRGVGEVIGLLKTHTAMLLIAWLFTNALRKSSSRINFLNQRSLKLAESAAASAESREIRRMRLEELAELATPLLQRIAVGTRADKAERTRYAIAESRLRDNVRARSLNVPAIVVATGLARERGTEVVLLDDRGAPLPTAGAMALLTERVVAELDKCKGGSVTIRMAPVGRDVAVSILREHNGEVDRTNLGENGLRLSKVAARTSA